MQCTTDLASRAKARSPISPCFYPSVMLSCSPFQTPPDTVATDPPPHVQSTTRYTTARSPTIPICIQTKSACSIISRTTSSHCRTTTHHVSAICFFPRLAKLTIISRWNTHAGSYGNWPSLMVKMGEPVSPRVSVFTDNFAVVRCSA